jgi:hypothetical protein
VRRDEVDTKSSGQDRPPLGRSAFGLSLLTDLTPPGAWQTLPVAEPILHMRSATATALTEQWSGRDSLGWDGVIDGAPFVVERGHAGDHRFVHGLEPHEVRAVHHLSADASTLQCAPSHPDDPSWWRVMLDSVLFTVALLHGYEALHAGALATPDGAIAITAGSGGGKSTLLSELIGHGLALVADDVLVLQARSTDTPLAYPAAPLMTVPAERAPILQPSSSTGAPPAICSIDEEHWIAVPVHQEPLPLAALVVLNRSPGLATGLYRLHTPLAALIASLLRFPRTRERELARFELASSIAAHVAIWQLDADPSVDPQTLAGLLLAEFVGPDRTPTRPLSTVS